MEAWPDAVLEDQRRLCDQHGMPHEPVRADGFALVDDRALLPGEPIEGVREMPIDPLDTGWRLTRDSFTGDTTALSRIPVRELFARKSDVVSFLGLPLSSWFFVGPPAEVGIHTAFVGPARS